MGCIAFKPVFLVSVLGIALLSGCASTTSTSVAPPVDLPSAWRASQAESAQGPSEVWWQGFESEELDRLMALAMQDSPDLRIASHRVRQAEWAVKQAGASLFPSLSLGGSTSSRRSQAGGGEQVVRSDATAANLSVSYEVDLWGRLGAGHRGAEASLDGSRYDLETARLTLTAGVANAYFQYLGLRNRHETASQNLTLAKRVLSIVETRARYGAASALDLSRQRTTVLSQEAALLPLEAQLQQTHHALALLVGALPSDLNIQHDQIERLRVPAVGSGLPASLLSRRPDLAAAEADMRVADASLEQARAALLPTLQLSAGASLGSSALLSLADPSKALSLAGSLTQSIFDGGRLRAQVGVSEASRSQVWETYRKSLLTAVKEVEDALVSVGRQAGQERQQTAIRDEAQRSLALAEQRYKAGAAGLSDVLDAQRTFYVAQDDMAQIRQARLTAAVDLIKALGGGWQLPAKSLANAKKDGGT